MSKKNKSIMEDNDIIDPQEEIYVTLELDDGTDLECQVISVFEVQGKDYIAMIPCEGEEEIFFYRYIEQDEETFGIDNIESDDEFEAVADRFDELLDEEEFENM